MKAYLKKMKPFLEKAVQTYQSFANADCPMNSKDFNAYHSACKSALLHIALLIKILYISPKKQPTNQTDLLDLIHQAKEDLKDENDISGIRMDLG